MVRRLPLSFLIACACAPGSRADDPPAGPPPHRVFASSRASIDATLARPYGPEVPFGSTGGRTWASSPQGWAFGDDVHWVYLTNFKAFDLEVADDRGLLEPAKATYYPSHVHLEGTTRAVRPSASFTFRADSVRNPLARPFRPEKRWTCWSSGTRRDWFAVDFGASRRLTGLKVRFFDDAPNGGCRPPESFEVQSWDGNQWLDVEDSKRHPERPAAGENTIAFEPLATERLRVVFRNAGESFYTGLYGFEPIGDAGAERPSPLEVSADKFITPDDVLAVKLVVRNPTDRYQRLVVDPVCDWPGEYQAKGNPKLSGLLENSMEPLALWRIGSANLHGEDVRVEFRYVAADDPASTFHNAVWFARMGKEDPERNNSRGLFLDYGGSRKRFSSWLPPKATKTVLAALQIRRPGESGFPLPDRFRDDFGAFVNRRDGRVPPDPDRPRDPLDAVVPLALFDKPPGQMVDGRPSRLPARDLVADQAAQYQAWFDANLPYFDCSDPWVRKLYYHRAYVLKKNMLDPKLGRLKWPTQAEGRWRSDWYPNVISYGAGHQVREARWLRDPKYWRGHIRTWAENERPDGIYPNDVKPTGPDGGLYTDWITSTAWDGHLVHPDKAFLAEVADKLAANVRGWQKVYDPDGDGLLFVDDHWWTGMEWQPSFFADSGYRTDPKDPSRPVNRVNLERVDLTSYQYGNAANLARIFRAIGRDAEAKEFEALAARIAGAVAAKMWDPESKFFYSLRYGDKSRVMVKEVVGVYPFSFGMFPGGTGYESAWASILDPEEFWTSWPVASVSKKCPAYAQDGWRFPSSRGTVCMWNGPTWPHANSFVLSGMARTIRAKRGGSTPLTVEKVWELFRSFTKAQYRDGDLNNPWTGEFYDGMTGAWKTAERDYNHSTWIDVLIDLIGVVPRADDVLEVDPLLPDGALGYFVLDGLTYHGRDVTIVWDAPGGEDVHGDGRTGLDVYLDRKLAASSPTLTRLLVDLKAGGR